MKFDLRRLLLRRFVEIFVLCMVLSVIEVLLNIFGVSTMEYLFPALLAGMILFFAVNTLMQRQYYKAVLGNMRCYFGTLISYAVFAVISIAVYYINYKLYVILFAITKFLSYYSPHITNMTSILIFHAIGFCVMSLSFIGLVGVTKNVKDEIMEEIDIQKNFTKLEQGIANDIVNDDGKVQSKQEDERI